MLRPIMREAGQDGIHEQLDREIAHINQMAMALSNLYQLRTDHAGQVDDAVLVAIANVEASLRSVTSFVWSYYDIDEPVPEFTRETPKIVYEDGTSTDLKTG
ncbi:MAG TPA: hypothetical protein VK070_07075 [Acidimicrobiia bacterium]|nr:hypothetical protein [Acidimicrobiia bacterium]